MKLDSLKLLCHSAVIWGAFEVFCKIGQKYLLITTTCLKLTTETLVQGAEYVQSQRILIQHLALVFLLLTLSR